MYIYIYTHIKSEREREGETENQTPIQRNCVFAAICGAISWVALNRNGV